MLYIDPTSTYLHNCTYQHSSVSVVIGLVGKKSFNGHLLIWKRLMMSHWTRGMKKCLEMGSPKSQPHQFQIGAVNVINKVSNHVRCSRSTLPSPRTT